MRQGDRAWAGALTCAVALFLTGPANAADKADFDGRTLFEVNCASCHGLTGKGDGPAAKSLETELKPLSTLAQRSGGFPEDYVRQVIDGREELRAHRKGAMPVWGTYFRMRHDGIAPDASTQTIIQFLVDYVKSLQVE